MKKVYTLLLISLFTFIARSQNPNPLLLDIRWYLNELTVNGITYPSTGDVLYPGILEFDVTDMGTWITVNAFASDVVYDPVLDEFETTTPTVTLFTCDMYCVLENAYLNEFYFKGGSPQIFSYEIIADAPGYRLIVTDSEGNFAVYKDTITLGIEDESKSSFVLHPNPATNDLFISSEGNTIENLVVYSVHGQRMISKQGNQTVLDVSSLSEGIYFLEITTENGSTVKKFIKE